MKYIITTLAISLVMSTSTSIAQTKIDSKIDPYAKEVQTLAQNKI